MQVLAGSAVVGSQATNYLKVYKIASGAAAATLMYGPLIIAAGSPGFPGGNGAVVDKAGFLWTGSGPFQYGAAGTYSVLRFDTSIATVNAAAKPVLAVTLADEANVRTLQCSFVLLLCAVFTNGEGLYWQQISALASAHLTSC